MSISTDVRATYTELERISPDIGCAKAAELVSGTIPGFVIRDAGNSLPHAVRQTKLGSFLGEAGFIGDVKEVADFTFNNAESLLPQDLTGTPVPTRDSWYGVGVAPLHSDIEPSCRGEKLSLHHTLRGTTELTFHEGRFDDLDLARQWDLLDEQTGKLLWENEANPDLINPEGYKVTVGPRDLLVFDVAFVHMARVLSTPRASEAVFFDRQEPQNQHTSRS